jgi:hypothetical protein
MRTVLVALCVAAWGCAPAMAQMDGGNPTDLTNIYNVARTLSFASACGVITHDMYASALDGQLDARVMSRQQPDPNVVRAGIAEGEETAKAGGCQYLTGNAQVVQLIKEFTWESIAIIQPGLQAEINQGLVP